MDNILWYFFLGMIVSFIGSIPVGAINLGVVKISLTAGLRPALFFSLGASLVELLYSYLAVRSIQFLPNLLQYALWFNLAAIPFFIFLGVHYWKAKYEKTSKKDTDTKSLVSGILVSLLNPLQIPFWVIWNTYFLENGWIMSNIYKLHIYVIGTAAGALLFLCLLSLFSGRFQLHEPRKLIRMNKGMGIFFISLGCLQAFRLLVF